MYPSQLKIFNLLKKKNFTLKEMQKQTGLSLDGIRGRVSEIRKQGYDITKINGKFHLETNKKITNTKKVLRYVETQNQFGFRITVDELINKTKLTKEEISEVLSYLYQKKQLLQITSNQVIIYKSFR